MNTNDLPFIHRYIPATASDAPVLLLLHGTGGDEDDLLGLGQHLWPGAALLSPRGQVLENGAPRFFRRLAMGVLDRDDLVTRTGHLVAFIAAAAERYGFDPARVVAVGFSNGANIAASTLLLYPDVLAGAVLLHAMVPLEPDAAPVLDGTPVFLGAGRQDPMVPAEGTLRLAKMLEGAGANVMLSWQPGGHTLTQAEIEAARSWLRTHFGAPTVEDGLFPS